MNIDLAGKLQPFFVAEDGSLQYAVGNIIRKDWAEILVTLSNGDSISLLRGENFKKHREGDALMLGVDYIFGIRFNVGMCCRSGRNMSILTASLEYVQEI